MPLAKCSCTRYNSKIVKNSIARRLWGSMPSIHPCGVALRHIIWGVIMADEKFSNFLTDIIDADLAEGKVDVVHTRFPPEPNGYLHIGSAKAIFINYTIAKHYGGLFNLRFDDTNPAREGDEYVQSILQDLKWLGAEPNGGIFYGSDYFERCYEYAEQLIKEGKAYVDDLTREQMQEYRGNDAGKPSRPSPYRDRTPEENLDLFRRMRAGEFADGEKTLRAKIDLASPNMNMRDPTIYRHQARRASPPGRQVVHLSDVRLRTPDSGRHRGYHLQPVQPGI